MARYRNFDGALRAGSESSGAAPALDDVRMRRAGLKSALSGLELALAAPYAHRAEWVTHVRGSLQIVHDVWTRHIVETEAPGAFLDELVQDSPRLSSPVERLRREHNDVLAMIVRGEQHLGDPPADPEYVAWADDLRVELTALLAALARHRQRGADLIYEAYDVDIGGGS